MAREIDRDEARERIAAGAALLDAQGPGQVRARTHSGCDPRSHR
jgi:hypothetical protein